VTARFVNDYIKIYAEIGRGEFVGRYHMMPVLVGKRILSLGMERGRSAYETFSIIPVQDVESLSPGSFLDRVWMLERTRKKDNDQDIIVGRWKKYDVAIPDYSISRIHCVFEISSRGYLVRDAGSRNGTIVDGNTLRKGEGVMILGGEQLTLGRFQFVFYTGRQFLDLLMERLSKQRRK